MSSTSSQASADLASDSKEPGCEPSRSARSSHSVRPFLESTGQTFQSSPMFESSSTRGWWTWLQRAFPAKTFHSLVKVPDLPECVRDSSGALYEPLAWWDGQDCCWRTWQRCLVEGWARFSEPWPRSGMTRNGIAFLRAPLVPLTSETAFGLVPTIGANEGKGSSSKRFLGSEHFRGAKMSEGLRTSLTDPIYTHPNFAEAAMGFPKDWTLLETPSSRKSRKSSAGQS
jgi:hypothetical protein